MQSAERYASTGRQIIADGALSASVLGIGVGCVGVGIVPGHLGVLYLLYTLKDKRCPGPARAVTLMHSTLHYGLALDWLGPSSALGCRVGWYCILFAVVCGCTAGPCS